MLLELYMILLNSVPRRVSVMTFVVRRFHIYRQSFSSLVLDKRCQLRIGVPPRPGGDNGVDRTSSARKFAVWPS